MSTRLSPDGMYYWDGASWVSTLSPDGRFRWNGSAWVPVPWAPQVQYGAPRAVRRPTEWTRPLQYAVAGWYGISALISLSLPFWMQGQMSQMMRSVIQRSQEQNPYATPPPPEFYNAMDSMMSGVLWVAVVIGLAIAVVIVIGALQRWVWLYYVVLVLLGLSVVSGPLNLLNFATGTYSSTYGYSPPAWLYVVGIVTWFPSTSLFVVMLIALVKRGPWGMVLVSGGGSPAA